LAVRARIVREANIEPKKRGKIVKICDNYKKTKGFEEKPVS
jgi:hypothetical protein